MKEKDHAWAEAVEQRYMRFAKQMTIDMICTAVLEAIDYDYVDESPKDPEDFRVTFSRDVITRILTIIRYREPMHYASLKDSVEREIMKRKDPDSYEADREAEEDRLCHELDVKG